MKDLERHEDTECEAILEQSSAASRGVAAWQAVGDDVAQHAVMAKGGKPSNRTRTPEADADRERAFLRC